MNNDIRFVAYGSPSENRPGERLDGWATTPKDAARQIKKWLTKHEASPYSAIVLKNTPIHELRPGDVLSDQHNSELLSVVNHPTDPSLAILVLDDSAEVPRNVCVRRDQWQDVRTSIMHLIEAGAPAL